MTINRDAFFRFTRGEFGVFNQPQVDGLNLILGFLDRDQLPRPWQAYLLATIYHECAQTWHPIEERGQEAYFNKYEPGTKLGKALGNTRRGDGLRYKGRGYVQLTGRKNYAWASTLPLKVDFEATPEAACEPEYAWAIMVAGCTVGAFTGKRLGDYVASNEPGFTTDFVNARRVINGTDKAELIAGYAVKFQSILRLSAAENPAPPAKVIFGGDIDAVTARAEAAEAREAAVRKEFDDLRTALRALLDAR